MVFLSINATVTLSEILFYVYSVSFCIFALVGYPIFFALKDEDPWLFTSIVLPAGIGYGGGVFGLIYSYCYVLVLKKVHLI